MEPATVSQRFVIGLLLALAGLGAGCGPPSDESSGAGTAGGPPWFEDATDAVGLDFTPKYL